MDDPAWRVRRGNGPIIAAAIHHGHAVRPKMAQLLAISESDRLREEDPYTGDWTSVAPTRIVGLRSRFEVDLNRPREEAVYLRREEAWGLEVWRRVPPPEVIQGCRALHDRFYREVRGILEALTARFGRVVVFDLHSYNHRRAGRDAPPADADDNPDVNLGTGSIDRRWTPVVDCLMDAMRSFDFLGRRLDVRENVRFAGGNFPRWIHDNFSESACAIAIEIKKFFMDEWSGEPYPTQMDAVAAALRSAAGYVLETLRQWK